MRSAALLSLGVAAGLAAAHGDHSRHVADPNADWMTRHMTEEHHMDSWDAGSFFALHDYNSDGFWQGDEVLRTYGLMDLSNKDVSLDKRSEVVHEVMNLVDANGDGEISRAEFADFMASGQTLPDMGTGPGHHGDDEYEYEIHHWELYHDENTKLEDLTHPEDIEHFRHHEEMEEAMERQDKMDQIPIVEDNIPLKFRRRS